MESWGAPGLELTVLIIDQTSLYVETGHQKLLCFLKSDYHEICGICISQHGVWSDDCGTEQRVRDRISCARVDGMGIFLSVLHIELSVVSGSYYSVRSGRDFENALDLRSKFVVSVYRLIDAHCPWQPVRIESVTEDFTDVDKHVLYADGI